MANSEAVTRRAPDQAPDQALVVGLQRIFTPTPKKAVGLGLYVLGIFLCCFFVPNVPSPEALDRYDGFMDKANAVPGFMEAEREYNLALMNMEEVEVWFWYWREPYKWEVPPLKAVVKQKERVLAKLVDQRKGLVLDAKRSVGPFSTFAVAEARSMFWDRVERGKLFAKRQSFWDALFMLMDSRSDDSVLGFFLKWFATFLMNFTIGLVTSFITFVFMVYHVVFSYSPDPLSGFLFYSGCVLAAFAMVATYIIGLYGAAATAVYAGAGMLANTARLQAAQRANGHVPRQRPAYLGQRPAGFGQPQQQYRRHYD